MVDITFTVPLGNQSERLKQKMDDPWNTVLTQDLVLEQVSISQLNNSVDYVEYCIKANRGDKDTELIQPTGKS